MFLQNSLYMKDIEDISTLNLPWIELDNSSVLITGATGMIGTVLIDILMERNLKHKGDIHIFAIGRSVDTANLRFSNYINHPSFCFLPCDVNKGISLDEDVDYIFHCASNTHPTSYANDPIGTIMTNVLGTEHVLRLAVERHSKRVLFLSSVEVYGENRGDRELFPEDYCGYIDCNTLRAGYPEGKRTGEALCQAFIHVHKLDIVIPRISRVFGPTMLLSDSKALSQFIKKAVYREDIVLKSEGNQYFSYIYVCDVVSALLYILFYGKSGEAYNISNEKADIRLKDLANILAEVANTKVVFELPDTIEAKGYSTATTARMDVRKIQKLGWKPRGEIREQLQKTVQILTDRIDSLT